MNAHEICKYFKVKGNTVSWPGYGSLARPDRIAKLLDYAAEIETDQLVFNSYISTMHNSFTLDMSCILQHGKVNILAKKIAEEVGPLHSVDFSSNKNAIKFVDKVEKALMWEILRRG